MSKELTPLEAYKHAKWCVHTIKANKKIGSETIRNEENDGLCDTIENCLDTIKNALKENEHLITDLFGLSQELFVKNRALEIIKEKICFVHNDVGMICDKNNVHYQITINQLTQEEYDLLREVLLWEQLLKMIFMNME